MNNELKSVKVLNYQRANMEESQYQVISQNDIVWFTWDEQEQEWRVDEENGNIQGVRLWNGQNYENFIDDASDCDVFSIFDSKYEIEKVDYKTGKDLIAFIDDTGDKMKALWSRWQGENGQLEILGVADNEE